MLQSCSSAFTTVNIGNSILEHIRASVCPSNRLSFCSHANLSEPFRGVDVPCATSISTQKTCHRHRATWAGDKKIASQISSKVRRGIKKRCRRRRPKCVGIHNTCNSPGVTWVGIQKSCHRGRTTSIWTRKTSRQCQSTDIYIGSAILIRNWWRGTYLGQSLNYKTDRLLD